MLHCLCLKQFVAGAASLSARVPLPCVFFYCYVSSEQAIQNETTIVRTVCPSDYLILEYSKRFLIKSPIPLLSVELNPLEPSGYFMYCKIYTLKNSTSPPHTMYLGVSYGS